MSSADQLRKALQMRQAFDGRRGVRPTGRLDADRPRRALDDRRGIQAVAGWRSHPGGRRERAAHLVELTA